jgi:hypothetical protein
MNPSMKRLVNLVMVVGFLATTVLVASGCSSENATGPEASSDAGSSTMPQDHSQHEDHQKHE